MHPGHLWSRPPSLLEFYKGGVGSDIIAGVAHLDLEARLPFAGPGICGVGLAAKKQNKTWLVTDGCVIETGYWRRIPARYWIDRWIHNGHVYIMDTGMNQGTSLEKCSKFGSAKF